MSWGNGLVEAFRLFEDNPVSVHRIRLNGPWDYQWHGPQSLAAAEPSGCVKMPCNSQLLFGSSAGSATFSRRFHRPTNLEPHEQVIIVLTGAEGDGTVALNGTEVSKFDATGEQVEADVTSHLLALNRLEIRIEFSPSPDEPPSGDLFAVVLEIRGTPP
jgi:hypothetical protein